MFRERISEISHRGRLTIVSRFMIVIGIAGGIASGKSLVASQFATLGALVLDADQAGHQVLLEEDIKNQVRQNFGEQVFGDNGEVDRGKLGGVVFHSADAPVKLKKLEQITHPRIRELLNRLITNLKARSESETGGVDENNVPAVVLDAPVMFKSGWKDFCDVIVFVDVPLEIRKRRAVGRGWSTAELEKREAMQTPVEEKRSKSDFVIQNDGTPDKTRQQVERIWHQLVAKQSD